MFQELEEIRPFELLKTQADRVNYLSTKQAKIVAMTCTHAALKRRCVFSVCGGGGWGGGKVGGNRGGRMWLHTRLAAQLLSAGAGSVFLTLHFFPAPLFSSAAVLVRCAFWRPP